MLSDFLFMIGVVVIALITGILLGDVGRFHESYCGSLDSLYLMTSTLILVFGCGYWSGRFFKGDK